MGQVRRWARRWSAFSSGGGGKTSWWPAFMRWGRHNSSTCGPRCKQSCSGPVGRSQGWYACPQKPPPPPADGGSSAQGRSRGLCGVRQTTKCMATESRRAAPSPSGPPRLGERSRMPKLKVHDLPGMGCGTPGCRQKTGQNRLPCTPKGGGGAVQVLGDGGGRLARRKFTEERDGPKNDRGDG